MSFFTEAEIEATTGNYHVVGGKGAFGTVYKGSLQHMPIVVKLLDPENYLVKMFIPNIPNTMFL